MSFFHQWSKSLWVWVCVLSTRAQWRIRNAFYAELVTWFQCLTQALNVTYGNSLSNHSIGNWSFQVQLFKCLYCKNCAVCFVEICTEWCYTHTRLTSLFPGLPRWAGTRKVKPIWILLKQETVSGSGISWAICKSAPRSRQISMPAPHHSVFYRPDALPAAQLTASKHWRHC